MTLPIMLLFLSSRATTTAMLMLMLLILVAVSTTITTTHAFVTPKSAAGRLIGSTAAATTTRLGIFNSGGGGERGRGGRQEQQSNNTNRNNVVGTKVIKSNSNNNNNSRTNNTTNRRGVGVEMTAVRKQLIQELQNIELERKQLENEIKTVEMKRRIVQEKASLGKSRLNQLQSVRSTSSSRTTPRSGSLGTRNTNTKDFGTATRVTAVSAINAAKKFLTENSSARTLSGSGTTIGGSARSSTNKNANKFDTDIERLELELSELKQSKARDDAIKARRFNAALTSATLGGAAILGVVNNAVTENNGANTFNNVLSSLVPSQLVGTGTSTTSSRLTSTAQQSESGTIAIPYLDEKIEVLEQMVRTEEKELEQLKKTVANAATSTKLGQQQIILTQEQSFVEERIETKKQQELFARQQKELIDESNKQFRVQIQQEMDKIKMIEQELKQTKIVQQQQQQKNAAGGVIPGTVVAQTTITPPLSSLPSPSTNSVIKAGGQAVASIAASSNNLRLLPEGIEIFVKNVQTYGLSDAFKSLNTIGQATVIMGGVLTTFTIPVITVASWAFGNKNSNNNNNNDDGKGDKLQGTALSSSSTLTTTNTTSSSSRSNNEKTAVGDGTTKDSGTSTAFGSPPPAAASSVGSSAIAKKTPQLNTPTKKSGYSPSSSSTSSPQFGVPPKKSGIPITTSNGTNNFGIPPKKELSQQPKKKKNYSPGGGAKSKTPKGISSSSLSPSPFTGSSDDASATPKVKGAVRSTVRIPKEEQQQKPFTSSSPLGGSSPPPGIPASKGLQDTAFNALRDAGALIDSGISAPKTPPKQSTTTTDVFSSSSSFPPSKEQRKSSFSPFKSGYDSPPPKKKGSTMNFAPPASKKSSFSPFGSSSYGVPSSPSSFPPPPSKSFGGPRQNKDGSTMTEMKKQIQASSVGPFRPKFGSSPGQSPPAGVSPTSSPKKSPFSPFGSTEFSAKKNTQSFSTKSGFSSARPNYAKQVSSPFNPRAVGRSKSDNLASVKPNRVRGKEAAQSPPFGGLPNQNNIQNDMPFATVKSGDDKGPPKQSTSPFGVPPPKSGMRYEQNQQNGSPMKKLYGVSPISSNTPSQQEPGAEDRPAFTATAENRSSPPPNKFGVSSTSNNNSFGIPPPKSSTSKFPYGVPSDTSAATAATKQSSLPKKKFGISSGGWKKPNDASNKYPDFGSGDVPGVQSSSTNGVSGINSAGDKLSSNKESFSPFSTNNSGSAPPPFTGGSSNTFSGIPNTDNPNSNTSPAVSSPFVGGSSSKVDSTPDFSTSSFSFSRISPPASPPLSTTAVYASTAVDGDSEVASMKVGEIKKELESYGISTVSFVEKSQLVEALKKARADDLKPEPK